VLAIGYCRREPWARLDVQPRAMGGRLPDEAVSRPRVDERDEGVAVPKSTWSWTMLPTATPVITCKEKTGASGPDSLVSPASSPISKPLM
jgi:hypothetical protein